VRYHLAWNSPRIDVQQWKLAVGGEGNRTPLQLGFADLHRAMSRWKSPPFANAPAIAAAFPRLTFLGVQWGLGAMGSAVWRGPRLKDVLRESPG